jgi:hypothetical protein
MLGLRGWAYMLANPWVRVCLPGFPALEPRSVSRLSLSLFHTAAAMEEVNAAAMEEVNAAAKSCAAALNIVRAQSPNLRTCPSETGTACSEWTASELLASAPVTLHT